MNRPVDPCYLCSKFRRHEEAPPGHGYCEGYEKVRRHDDDNRACPLWLRAKDEARRRRWAEQQKENV